MRDDTETLRQSLELYRQHDYARAQMLLETLDLHRLEDALLVEAHYLWGLTLARRGDLQEAATHFRACLRHDRRFFAALDAWGNVLSDLGDARGAIDKYKRALGLADSRQAPHVQFNYAHVLHRHGYTLRALAKFRDCYRTRGDEDSAYMVGACYLALRRPAGAVKWMQRAHEASPRSARNLVGLGNAFALSGAHSRAIAQYQAALAFDPACAEAHYNWALALAAQGEYALAARRCKQGLRVAPDAFEMLAQQTYCLRRMGAYDAALQAARRMREVLGAAPASARKPEFLDVLTANEAACLRELGRRQLARTRLLEQLRRARDASTQSLAELRFLDRRRLRGAHRYELTVNVRVPALDSDDELEPTMRHYQRSYWVIARDVKSARRIVRELEPTDAELRFDARTVVGKALDEADQGVTERTPAVPVN